MTKLLSALAIAIGLIAAPTIASAQAKKEEAKKDAKPAAAAASAAPAKKEEAKKDAKPAAAAASAAPAKK